jgi:periplasmic protein TonB
MNVQLRGAEQLEQTLGREPLAGPAAGSLLLHGALAGTIVFWALINGLFHHNTWGGTAGGGAIQVQITSALPLPAQKVNDNVLSTETPSEAPAISQPKPEQQQLDLQAIPIPGREVKPKTKPQPTPRTPQRADQKPLDNRATYGEQSGTVMPRSMSQSASNGPTAVADSDFGSRFPWYVDAINRKMSQDWNKGEVDASTPRGAQVYIVFTIRRDGTPASVQLDRSSGSGSLDRSCIRAAQRVDTFGQLPAAYNQSTLKVSYYCEY